MGILNTLMGSNSMPGYLKQLNRATANYQTAQMNANQANWANARSAAQLGADSDISYATAAGAWLNQNPYLNGIVDGTTRQIVNSYNGSAVPQALSSYAASGRYGSGMMQNTLAGLQSQMMSDVGSAASQLYYDNYNTERGYMEAAQARLSEQYDPLKRSSQYADIINAGQYNVMEDTEKKWGLFETWLKFNENMESMSRQYKNFGEGTGSVFKSFGG